MPSERVGRGRGWVLRRLLPWSLACVALVLVVVAMGPAADLAFQLKVCAPMGNARNVSGGAVALVAAVVATGGLALLLRVWNQRSAARTALASLLALSTLLAAGGLVVAVVGASLFGDATLGAGTPGCTQSFWPALARTLPGAVPPVVIMALAMLSLIAQRPCAR